MGENWFDLMSSWSTPNEQTHSCGTGFALRAISSAVATHDGHKPSKMREALGTSLLSNASLHWSKIKNAAPTPENPMCGFCKPARSVRRPWMTDEQIREALAVHCRNTRPATAQPQDKLPLLRLQGSLARAMKNTPKISKVYAESTIYHRVRIHSPKPGVMIGKARKKVDVCDDSQTWDKVAEMAILSLIADTMDELTAQCENYWCGFGTMCEAKGPWLRKGSALGLVR